MGERTTRQVPHAGSTGSPASRTWSRSSRRSTGSRARSQVRIESHEIPKRALIDYYDAFEAPRRQPCVLYDGKSRLERVDWPWNAGPRLGSRPRYEVVDGDVVIEDVEKEPAGDEDAEAAREDYERGLAEAPPTAWPEAVRPMVKPLPLTGDVWVSCVRDECSRDELLSLEEYWASRGRIPESDGL